MKNKTFAINTIGVLGSVSLLASAVQAGDMSYAGGAGYGAGGAGADGSGLNHGGAVPGMGGLLEELGGTLSTGFDSDYYWRGQHLGGQPIWTGLDLEVPLSEGFDLGLGAWYINPTDGGTHNDELDLYATTGISLGELDATLGFTQYTFPELSDSGESELSLGFGINPMDLIDLGVGIYYNLDSEVLYGELSTGTHYDLADGVSVALGATLGAILDGDDVDSDLTHLLLSASLPIALSDNARLEPYVAANVQLDAFEPNEDEDLFGGVSLSVDF